MEWLVLSCAIDNSNSSSKSGGGMSRGCNNGTARRNAQWQSITK
jgi:hypothetical protein